LNSSENSSISIFLFFSLAMADNKDAQLLTHYQRQKSIIKQQSYASILVFITLLYILEVISLTDLKFTWLGIYSFIVWKHNSSDFGRPKRPKISRSGHNNLYSAALCS